MVARRLDDVPRYLVEWYRPGLAEERLEQTARRIGHAARETSEAGIELLLIVFVPDDEVAFCLFAAGSADLVARVCRRAQLPWDRITEAVEATPS